MTSGTALKKNAAKKQTISTSEARANFAEALDLAQEESTVIGFDRYGKLVAALVPIDAVRMLAGRGEEVEPAVRGKIERMSRIFLTAQATMRHPSAAKEERATFAAARTGRKRRKDKRDKKKSAKAARGKRPRKISRKI
ncbi:MAG: hypothetical protein HY054_03065 [Proteobacteria bacterium]|nr:hypothetical protein [Pseudomonadota bacterium]